MNRNVIKQINDLTNEANRLADIFIDERDHARNQGDKRSYRFLANKLEKICYQLDELVQYTEEN